MQALRNLCLALLLLPGAALAFTPESGVWGDRNNTRTGMTFDVQDNILIITAYIYRADGSANWFSSAGPLNYVYNANGGLLRVSYQGTFDAVTGGTCIGCGPAQAVSTIGAGGAFRIDFATEIRGQMTWQGRQFPIDRATFALGNPTERMLGEWNLTLDFKDRGNQDYPYADFPFFGDVLVIDRIDRTRVPNQYQGCRPGSSLDGFCSAIARANHDLAGFYDAAAEEHVIVLKDVPAAGGARAVFFAYFLDAGTSQFDGVVELYLAGDTPGDGPFYPVRGFRSASRTYVLTGAGPARAEPGDKAHRAQAVAGLSQALAKRGALPAGLNAAEVKTRYDIDVSRLAPMAALLTAQISAR